LPTLSRSCIAAKAAPVSSNGYVVSITGANASSATNPTRRSRSDWVPVVEPTMRLCRRNRPATSVSETSPAARPQTTIVPPRRRSDWLRPVYSPPRWLTAASTCPSTASSISATSADSIPRSRPISRTRSSFAAEPDGTAEPTASETDTTT